MGSRALYLIATLPEEERENYDEALRHFGKTKTRQLGIMPEKERKEVIEYGISTDEGVKNINEATTREIEAYQKQLKQKDHEVDQARRSEQIALKKLEEAENKEPEVIRMMKVADELPNSSTLTNLGSSALYLIATHPLKIEDIYLCSVL